MITWARVSTDVDTRMSEIAGKQPLRLRPDEWTSGEIYWLIDAVGDRAHLARP
ncbi:MAG: toxin-activating lysine-acyltransferase [Pseudomonadota bacterium]